MRYFFSGCAFRPASDKLRRDALDNIECVFQIRVLRIELVCRFAGDQPCLRYRRTVHNQPGLEEFSAVTSHAHTRNAAKGTPRPTPGGGCASANKKSFPKISTKFTGLPKKAKRARPSMSSRPSGASRFRASWRSSRTIPMPSCASFSLTRSAGRSYERPIIERLNKELKGRTRAMEVTAGEISTYRCLVCVAQTMECRRSFHPLSQWTFPYTQNAA